MTKKDLLNSINSPFNQMLTALAAVPGYEKYLEWLSRRVDIDESWQAEIKSLFEVNKETHPLIRISGPEESEPEGVFRISGKLGMLEAAYIKYKFDDNQEKRKCANLCTELFNLVKVKDAITDNNWLVVIVDSVDSPPSLEDAAFIKSYLKNNEPDNSLNKALYGYYGHFKSQHFMQLLGNLISPKGLGFICNNKGSALIGYNVHLTKKVLQVLTEKRKQHKKRYPNNIKVYYMLVDGPPTVLEQIDSNEILKQLKENEIVIVSTIYLMNGKHFDRKLKLQKSASIRIDFSNRFLE